MANFNTGLTKQQIITALTKALESMSEQEVQSAISTAVSGKQDILSFDNTPTSDSSNPVTSGGIYTDQLRQETEIGVVAEQGAKNMLKHNNAAGYTLTTHGRTFEVLADGGIKITGDTPDSSYADFYVSGTWGTRDPILNASENNCVLSFDCAVSLQTDNLYIRAVDRRTGSTANSATARLNQEAEFSFPVTTVLITVQPSVVLPSGGITVYPMIRRAEIKDSTFAQYAPTNRDLSASLADIVEDIKELEDEIEKKNHIEINMEIGGLSSQGALMNATNRIRTKGFIPCNPAYGTIHFDINTKHRFAYYTGNSAGDFIAFSDWSTATDDTITWPAGKTTASLYILVGYTNDRTISSENMPKVWFDYYTPEGATVNYVAGYAIQAAYSKIQTISNFCLSAPIPVQPNTTYRAKKFRNTMTLDADLLPVRSMATVDIENNTLTTGATEHFIVFCWRDTENPQYFSEADDFVEGVAIKGLVPVPLIGKKLSLLGDSISSYAGTIPAGNDVYYTGNNSGVSSPDEMWWSVLCSKTGMVPLVINGWSGSGVTRLTDSSHSNKVPMSDVSRCQQLHSGADYPDIILIAGGVNDYSYANSDAHIPSDWDGHTEPVSGNSFSETYACMIKDIQEAYPEAIIVCLSTWFTQRGTDNGYTYVNAMGYTQPDYDADIERVARIMRVSYINCEQMGFNRYNFYPNFAQDSSTIPTHPNATGQRTMGEYIADMIPQIVNSFTRNAPEYVPPEEET